MSEEGVDYAWARPGGAKLKANGKTFAMRYVDYPGAGGKELGPEELADLKANGIAVGLVYEQTAGRIFEGGPAGTDDANQCVVSGTVLGWPADRPFYFACDADATEDQLAYVDDYLVGAASVLGVARVGIYGEAEVVDHCLNAGTATWGWQTYAWSGGVVSSLAHVLQYSNGEWGGTVDFCRSLKDDFGQWGDDMTSDEVNKLIENFLSIAFPAYIEAYFGKGFSARNGVKTDPDGVNPEGKSPIKPWMEDLEARLRTVPGISADQ